MATKQGYLKEKGSQDKLAPKTLDSLVKDSARNRALSASLQELAERQCLGYPPFATTQNYTVGDKVFYDRKLWKFTSSHTAGAWNASHVTAWSVEDEVSELKLAVTALDERKANIDGFYEGMGVGVAKRLEGNTDVAGSFLERTTGGDAELANGLAQLNEVQGGSVKFNQLAEAVNIMLNDSTKCSVNENTVTVLTSSASTGAYLNKKYNYGTLTFPQGHKVVVFVGVSVSSDMEVGFAPDGYRSNYNFQNVSTTTKRLSFYGENSYAYLYFGWRNANVNDTITISNVSYHDLTAIFGAGNEPSTVAEFEAWLAINVGLKDYYDYTEGEVVNNNMTGIESTGFNLFNPTTGKARIIGAYSDVYGNYYGIRGTYGTLTFEDDLGNVSTVTPDADGKAEFDVPGYINVADAGSDVAVFLWWDGKKTDYEDYDVEIAHLDVSHIYGKKNGTGDLVQVWPTGMPRINDVVDKLCIENGAVVAKRPIQEVDLGTLTWGGGSTGNYKYFNTNSLKDYIKHAKSGTDIITGLLCVKYNKFATSNSVGGASAEGAMVVDPSGNFYIQDTNISASTGPEFKTAMSGVLLYFELATPETYTDLVYMGSEYFADGTPVTLPVNYKVDNWGVESILPKNTSTILTAKPTIKVRYAIDAVEQLNTHSDKIEDLYDGLDELDEAKANTVGVYDNMVAGAAKAIAGNHRLDKVFTSMVVDGADGVAKINEVRGKSIVWNQLKENGDFSDGLANWSVYKGTATVDNGIATVVTNLDNTDVFLYRDYDNFVSGHKYLMKATVLKHGGNTAQLAPNNISNYTKISGNNLLSIDDVWTRLYLILTMNTTSEQFRIFGCGGAVGNYFKIKNFVAFDLTQMFGAGNEPATVEEFEALFPDAYYEYNDGEIINNATEALDVTGFNQWDEEWEKGNITSSTGQNANNDNMVRSKNYIKVIAGQTYYLTSPTYAVYFRYYDANKQFIPFSQLSVADDYRQNKTTTIPDGVAYIRFTFVGTTAEGICINLSDPSRNGTYEPYKHGVVPLNLSTITGKQVGVEDAESVVIFPDGMRQAGSVADTLLVDDDGYARRALVKIGSVDLGTLTWEYQDNTRFKSVSLDDYKLSNNVPVICSKYNYKGTVTRAAVAEENNSVYLYYNTSSQDHAIYIVDTSCSDAATFKTAMSGVMLYYELAEYKEYILDEPILMTFKAYHGGTIVQSPQAPDSAPMSMNVTFAVDAVGTLNNLPKNYISADSMDAFLAQLGTAMNGTWTKSWDAINNRYGFTFTPNTEGE